jgi:type I restriction enzyme S subunit
MTWQNVTLDEVAELLIGFAFKSTGFLDAGSDGIKLVRGDNVQQGAIRWGEKAKKWPAEDFDDLTRYQLRLGDVILAMDRPIVGGGLKLAWIKDDDLPCLLVQRVCCVRGKEDIGDTLFLRYVLSAPRFSAHIDRITTGANIPHISGKDIAAYSFRLPPIDEQRRIGKTIAAYDDLIENNQRRIQLLEEAARRLYREWFVALRFPEHERVQVVEGVPQGWKQATLGDALQLQRGFDLPSGARKEGAVPIIASTGVTGFHDEARVCGPGVVTGRSGTLGSVHFVHEDFWPLNTSLWVKEFRGVTPLVAYFMLQELGLSQFNSGASVPTLDRKVVHPMPAIIPPTQVQAEFEAVAAPMFSQVRTLTQAANKARQARDALLPRLISGALAV